MLQFAVYLTIVIDTKLAKLRLCCNTGLGKAVRGLINIDSTDVIMIVIYNRNMSMVQATGPKSLARAL